MGYIDCAKRFLCATVGSVIFLSMSTTGRLGEQYVARILEKRGWQILLRNWRDRYVEVDLVARTPEGSLRIIEVKTRRTSSSSRAELEEIISKRQHRRLRLASLRLPFPCRGSDIHIDAALVRLAPSHVHITYLADCYD